eukprot:scaffold3183_cov381-Prasinococcus_capsulatus_cf.AAC.1
MAAEATTLAPRRAGGNNDVDDHHGRAGQDAARGAGDAGGQRRSRAEAFEGRLARCARARSAAEGGARRTDRHLRSANPAWTAGQRKKKGER